MTILTWQYPPGYVITDCPGHHQSPLLYANRPSHTALTRNSKGFNGNRIGPIRHILCGVSNRQLTEAHIASRRRIGHPSPDLVALRGSRYGTYTVHAGPSPSPSSLRTSAIRPSLFHRRAWNNRSCRKRRIYSGAGSDSAIHNSPTVTLRTVGSGNNPPQDQRTLGSGSAFRQHHRRRAPSPQSNQSRTAHRIHD